MKVVIGVDSGGSSTRALAVNLEGEVVAYAETGGGNPVHDAESSLNVAKAIWQLAETCGTENVLRIVAGIAGVGKPEDATRLSETIAFRNPETTQSILNDTEVAHFASHSGQPGIVSIQGTGSLILAILENGRRVTTSDFHHYVPSGAVRLGRATVVQLLTQDEEPDHAEFLDEAYRLWGVSNRGDFQEAQSHVGELPAKEESRRFGQIAQAVTRAATEGNSFAQRICRMGAEQVVEGIRLLGPLFEGDEVRVALIGSCVLSDPIQNEVARLLAPASGPRYRLVKCEVEPVIGAVRMALREEGSPVWSGFNAPFG